MFLNINAQINRKIQMRREEVQPVTWWSQGTRMGTLWSISSKALSPL
jgi:hypothetical protein